MTHPALCRECLAEFTATDRCPNCHVPRILQHPELHSLSIAHMDCDAFYASVEKRDNPELKDKPVIIGGGRRGVVSTACYIARIHGVHSAMPMFQALKLCPDAVVIKPRMSAYASVSADIRQMMQELTPSVDPLSLDEAFLDLTGTANLHGCSPAMTMVKLIKRMENELGLSGSVGLSHNKFLAKLASDMNKPRGFSIIGKAETEDILADLPVKKIWGVGKVLQKRLERDGIRSISDLRRFDRKDLAQRYDSMGDRLWHLARGMDNRGFSEPSKVKSISNETTFFEDTANPQVLEGHLWRLSEQVSDRAKAKEIAGRVVVLKVKKSDHRILTRRQSLRTPTHMTDRIYHSAQSMLRDVLEQGPFRLIGVGLSELATAREADQSYDLLEQASEKRMRAERATDEIRAKFGKGSILKGRALR